MVIWITGISGSGKSTLGKYFFNRFKKTYKNSIFFDGDEFRSIFLNDINYTLNDRDKNAKRLTSLTKYLSDQKVNIIISANITSQKYRNWCKKNIKNYFELFLETSFNNLLKRDYKNLYKKALKKKIKNVVGFDIPFKRPKNSDLIIKNNGSKQNLYKNYFNILKIIKKKKLKVF